MILNWLTSKKVREATGIRKHVDKLLQHQRDILSPKAIDDLEGAMKGISDAVAANADNEALDKAMNTLEETAKKWVKPYPNTVWRENIEVLLVALAVAMAIRTFFLQPFKIPTASMQPTLFGITGNNMIDTGYQKPTGWARVKDWFAGGSYVSFKADEDGTFDGVSKPLRFLIVNIKQTIWFAGKPHTIWFPPDAGGGSPLPLNPIQTLQAAFMNLPASKDVASDLEGRMGVRRGTQFHKGDDVVKMKIISGDHLFIDRLTYNFRAPARGDIVVFETTGIDRLPPDQQGTFYIKRLVGLGDETLTIKPDILVTGVLGWGDVPAGHLVINGHPLSASTPHFENLYAFLAVAAGTNVVPYKPDRYYGHAQLEGLGPGQEYQVRPDSFFVMGDNTMNSSDSRFWGDFPQSKVIGKAFFIYWPISDRFGWGYN